MKTKNILYSSKRSYFQTFIALLMAFCPVSNALFAQTDLEKLPAVILHEDSLFWKAYNDCDTAQSRRFFTEDVEFYHDKGGLTQGRENLVSITKKNLCSNDDFRLRREAVEGSVRVFPLQSSNNIYGAILTGEHVFYIRGKDKEEYLDGLAKFSHVWLLKDSTWKMSRILSYDHQPATYVNKRKEIQVFDLILSQYTGKYKGPQTGTLEIRKGSGTLILVTGNQQFTLHPETETLFFVKERDLTFEFVKNEQNKVSKMVVREKGEVMETAVYAEK